MNNGFEKKIQTLKTKVEMVLATDPETRNSDIKLLIAVWRSYYPEVLYEHPSGELYVKLAYLFDLPREDHIKRVRAQIQNVEQRYLPTRIDVFIERARLSSEWKRGLGYQAWWKDEQWTEAIHKYHKQRDEERQQKMF